MALLVPVQVVLGLASERLENATLAKALLISHYQLGMVLLALLAARVAWRLATGTPADAGVPSAWQRRTARSVHLALYALLLALPASGYVVWVWMDAPRTVLGLVEIPALFTPPPHDESGRAVAWYIHVWGAWVLMGLAGLHVGAAAWRSRTRGDRMIAGRMG